MGLFRKMTSVSTLGAVDYRSDKERTAKYSKQGAKEARKQTAIMQQQLGTQQSIYEANQRQAMLDYQRQVQAAQRPAASAPAGWYPNPQAPGFEYWWDGFTYTGQSRPTAR